MIDNNNNDIDRRDYESENKIEPAIDPEYFKENQLFSIIHKKTDNYYSILGSNNDYIIDNSKIHYACPLCFNFPLIKVVEGKIYLICKDMKIELKKDFWNFYKDEFEKKTENIKNNNLCNSHKKEFIAYCTKCKNNLCQECVDNNKCPENENTVHLIIYFKELDKEIEKIENDYNDYFIINNRKSEINKTNQSEKDFSKGLKSIEEKQKLQENESEKINEIQLEKGEKIIVKEPKNLEKKLNEFEYLRDLKSVVISDSKNFKNYRHYENMKIIHHLFCDKLNIEYFSYNNLNQTKIRLFGENFVRNNKNNCSVFINDELKKLDECEFYTLPDPYSKLEVILYKENDITNMSYMFDDCELLSKIKGDSKWGTKNVINMRNMFYNCKALVELPEIFSEFDTSNVEDMSYIFYGCESLSKIPDISKWRTDKVKKMSFMFYNCRSLEKLSDISQWDTSQVENMCNMFCDCKMLEYLKNIFKWKTGNVINMSHMFQNCLSLRVISDNYNENENYKDNNLINNNDEDNKKKWDTSKVKNMDNMFDGCESLEILPENISDWNIAQVQYMSFMFRNCKSLVKLPDISKWGEKTKNILNINNMFENCSSLKELPNIINWNIDNLNNINDMIEGCDNLEKIPDFSKWKDSNILFKGGKKLEKYFGP